MRLDDRLAKVPVIVFTAADYMERWVMQAGAECFLLKGKAQWSDLLSAVQQLSARAVV